MEQNTICTTVVMTAERMDFWEFLYVDKGNILVRAADDFAESGAVLLTLRREREEKADDSKRFELTEETAHLKSSPTDSGRPLYAGACSGANRYEYTL